MRWRDLRASASERDNPPPSEGSRISTAKPWLSCAAGTSCSDPSQPLPSLGMGRHGRRGDGRDPRGEVPDGLGGLLPGGGPGPRGRGGFAIDRGTVTVAGFARFAEETGYRTLAERPPEAADYPDADPLLLVAGSAVFRPTPHPVPLYSAECVGQSDTTDDASSRRVFATVEEAVEAATTLRSGNTSQTSTRETP